MRVCRRFTRVLAVALLLAACGSGSPSGAPRAPRVRVLAAASLTEAFGDLQADLTERLDVSTTFAGSQALARQLRDGAPADVFASADERTMDALVADGIVEDPRTFARNRLEIAVRPGNPHHVGGLVDLARGDLTVVLADPSVPVGRYARQALDRAGVSVHPRSLELDVKAALAKVTSGEADAAIVYASDVAAAGERVSGVAIPDADNVVASYPIAIVAATEHRAAAEAFIDAVVGRAGQDALRKRGFLGA